MATPAASALPRPIPASIAPPVMSQREDPDRIMADTVRQLAYAAKDLKGDAVRARDELAETRPDGERRRLLTARILAYEAVSRAERRVRDEAGTSPSGPAAGTGRNGSDTVRHHPPQEAEAGAVRV